jgi:hypothetical protein
VLEPSFRSGELAEAWAGVRQGRRTSRPERLVLTLLERA